MSRFSSPLIRLALSCCLTLLAWSAPAADFVRARVYTRGSEVMQLYIDGNLVGQPAVSFELPSLASGYHWLEFHFPNRRLPQNVVGYRTQAWFAPGFESVYELDAFPAGQRMKLTRIACTPLPGTVYNPPPTTSTNPGGAGYNPDPNAAGVQCANMMQPNDVSALVQTIESRDFENTKLSVAKQALDRSTLLADDVKRIMKTFEYESTRLEFAKYAYSRCCDQRNYFKINDAFEYDSSVSEMQRFTSGRGR